MHKQVANDELHSFYHFQTSVSSIINFRYPQFVLKMSTVGEGLSAIICKMLPQILIITKKLQIPVFSGQCSCYYTLYLFHYLSDIRLISGLMGAIAMATEWQMPWSGNFCTVNLTDKVL